jgi:hypothetical protein
MSYNNATASAMPHPFQSFITLYVEQEAVVVVKDSVALQNLACWSCEFSQIDLHRVHTMSFVFSSLWMRRKEIEIHDQPGYSMGNRPTEDYN